MAFGRRFVPVPCGVRRKAGQRKEYPKQEGKKAFLLAQGYMSAQEFHLLKNDLHPSDPWYYEDEIRFPFEMPEYTFNEGSMRSLKY